MKIHFILVAFALSGTAWAQQGQPAGGVGDEEQQETTAQPAQPTGGVGDEEQQDTAATGDTTDEQAGFSRGSVVRSVFTTGINEREPVDKLRTAESEDSIFYFTELRDMSGQTATHRWEHDGKVMAEVKFDVRGPRWRVWSSKTLTPELEGEWKVSVLNGAGEIISEDVVTYSHAEDAQQPTLEEKAQDVAPISEPMQQ